MLVNGEFTIDGEEFMGTLAGRVLERHRVQRSGRPAAETDGNGGER